MKPLVRLLVLFAYVATASAQMKVGISRPMSAHSAGNLQRFLGSPAGAPLLAMHPGLQTVSKLDVSNPAHLQILGPLSARLNELSYAISGGDEKTVRTMYSNAYINSSDDALGEIDARVRAAVKSAASDTNAWRNLVPVASDLESYSLYGEAARERVTIFAQKAAAVRSQKLAQDIFQKLLAGLRAAEDVAGPNDTEGGVVAAPDSSQTRPGSKLQPSKPRVGDEVAMHPSALRDLLEKSDDLKSIQFFAESGRIVVWELNKDGSAKLLNERGDRQVIPASQLRRSNLSQTKAFSRSGRAETTFRIGDRVTSSDKNYESFFKLTGDVVIKKFLIAKSGVYADSPDTYYPETPSTKGYPVFVSLENSIGQSKIFPWEELRFADQPPPNSETQAVLKRLRSGLKPAFRGS